MTTYLDSSTIPSEQLQATWRDHFYTNGVDTITPIVRNIPSIVPHWEQKNVVQSDVTPGYHKLLKQGKLVPFTRHHVVGEKCTHVYATGTEPVPFTPPDPSWIGGSGGWTEDVGSPAVTMRLAGASFPDAPPPLSYDPLLTKALGEAKSGALLILLELAEAPKMVKLFSEFNQRLSKRARAIRRTVRKRYNPQTTREAYKLFSDAWLEYRYGWRQLYYSANDLVDAVNLLRKEQWYVVNTGRGFATQSLDGTVTANQLGSAGIFGNNRILTSYASITREQRATVSLQVHKAQAALDVNLVGLGWELIPYSFVVDWFVNIGDVARASWPVPYVDKTVATSTKIVEQVRATFRRDPIVLGHWSSDIGTYTHTREEYERIPFTGEIPIVFNYNQRLGISNILDIIALAKRGLKSHNANQLRI